MAECRKKKRIKYGRIFGGHHPPLVDWIFFSFQSYNLRLFSFFKDWKMQMTHPTTRPGYHIGSSGSSLFIGRQKNKTIWDDAPFLLMHEKQMRDITCLYISMNPCCPIYYSGFYLLHTHNYAIYLCVFSFDRLIRHRKARRQKNHRGSTVKCWTSGVIKSNINNKNWTYDDTEDLYTKVDT